MAIPTAVQFPARATDIKWSEQHRLLYLALPASNGPAGNRVVALDPHTNQAVYSQRSCSEPAALALSDDHQYLHVACNGSSSVQRFRLPELSLEREFFLGRDGTAGIPFRINDMVAVPGRPQSVVVALGTDAAGVAPSITRVYDDGVPRPVELGAITGGDCTSLGWDLTRTRLLCAKTASSAFALQEAALTADGLRVTRTASGVFRAFGVRMAVDPTSGMVYGDDGSVFDPAAWRLSGRADLRGPVAPDSARNRLFVASPNERLVRSLDASTLAVTPMFAGGSAQPRRLIRWGATGLAMTTNGNSVIVYGGSGSSSFDTNTPRGTATERVLSVQIKQLIADPAGTLLYASVGPDAAEYANSVIAIDPYSGTVTRSRVLGRAPNALAVSGDGRFLYVGVDGAGTVQRLRLPSMDLDLTISLGQSPLFQLPYTAGLIRVSPAQPSTVAVTRVLPNISSSQLGGVVILDDAVQRPIVAGGEASTTGFLFPSDLAWNDDGSSLYALDTFSNSLVSLAVSDAGVSLGARLGSVVDLVGALRFDKVNRLLSSDGGGVLDLTSGLPIGTYRRAFHLGPHQVQLGPAGTEVFTLYLNQPAEFAPVSEIAVYDATTFLPKKIYAIAGSDELITYNFVQLRPGWFAFRSSKGVHIVELAL